MNILQAKINSLLESDQGRLALRYAKRHIPSWIWSIVRLIFLCGLSFVVLYPFLISISVSFRTLEDITDPSVLWIPKHFTLDNLKMAWETMKYPYALAKSFEMCVLSSLMQVASCAIVGYGFARFKFRFQGLLFGLVIFTFVIPPQTVFLPTYMMYKTYNILDSTLTMWLPALFGVGIRSGLFIYIFRQFYRGLPREIEEAALVDGCGHYQTFWKIILPNVKTAILTVFLFSIVWYWNDYYNSTMYFSNSNTVTMALSKFKGLLETGSGKQDPYLVSAANQAACLLSVVPVLLLYVVCHRFFTEGIERTGIVG